jgi:hypothetical protein
MLGEMKTLLFVYLVTCLAAHAGDGISLRPREIIYILYSPFDHQSDPKIPETRLSITLDATATRNLEEGKIKAITVTIGAQKIDIPKEIIKKTGITALGTIRFWWVNNIFILQADRKDFSIGWGVRIYLRDGKTEFKEFTEPNQSLQTTNRTVTECAPSRTLRASAIRV